jgi:hypothetical protein
MPSSCIKRSGLISENFSAEAPEFPRTLLSGNSVNKGERCDRVILSSIEGRYIKVHPALFLVLIMASALVGALAGIIFEGLLDKYLMLPIILGKFGIAQAEEAFSTVIGAVLATTIVGLVGFIALAIYTTFSSRHS